jgi:(E)-4-hydroxy-3-methylbut-2-enyl-diphosphate synthase
MTKTDTRDTNATVNQIRELEECGCELIRIAVPDMEAAHAIPQIKQAINIPLIADIHFDYRLALEALNAGVDALRLNPGNIGDTEQIKTVVKAAKERGIPIRIGMNAGSLPKHSHQDLPLAERMAQVALDQIHLLEGMDFDLIKVSLKAFDVPQTVRAYQVIASKTPYPLHLGITEAGLPPAGVIRSAMGIGVLLCQGIGDTIRVSLTAHPREEIAAAYEILKGLNLREHGTTLVSCPTCGRCEVDLIGLASSVREHLAQMKKPIKVAVMGCVVNGPGEAKDADVGIACGKGRGAIFRKGKVIRTVEEKDFLEALMAEIGKV